MSRGNRISLLESIKRRDPHLAGIKRKISQRESQKLNFIIKVLDYALKHEPFTVNELRQNLGISRNSIDRTLLLLKEKRLVRIVSIGLKNKKFYKISYKNHAKSYLNDLQKWRSLKIFLKASNKGTLNSFDQYQRWVNRINRSIKRGTKISKFSSRNPDILESTPIQFRNKIEQKKYTDIPWPQRVNVKDLPASFVIKIREKYRNFRLCDVCLQDGRLIDTINYSETELVCTEKGHFINLIDE